MNKNSTITFLLTFMAATTSFAQTAKVNTVTLENVNEYKDFRIESRTTKRDTDRLINDLKNQIQRSINRTLPIDQSMHITILDVDIAGDVSPSFHARKIRSKLDSSLLSFKYEIFDLNGNVIKQDKVVLEDKFLDTKSLRLNMFRNSYFKYEMVMFSKWIKNIVKTN